MEDGHILAQQTGFVNPFLKKSFHHAAACASVGDMQDGGTVEGEDIAVLYLRPERLPLPLRGPPPS